MNLTDYFYQHRNQVIEITKDESPSQLASKLPTTPTVVYVMRDDEWEETATHPRYVRVVMHHRQKIDVEDPHGLKIYQTRLDAATAIIRFFQAGDLYQELEETIREQNQFYINAQKEDYYFHSEKSPHFRKDIEHTYATKISNLLIQNVDILTPECCFLLDLIPYRVWANMTAKSRLTAQMIVNNLEMTHR